MRLNKQTTHTAAYDIQLLFPVLFLVGIGIVMVYSASSAVALKKFGSDYLFLRKQALFALMGIVALVICRHFPYQWYRPLTYPFLTLALIFLIAIQFTDYGLSAGGSARWLRFGKFSFQPSEFAPWCYFWPIRWKKRRPRSENFRSDFCPIFSYLLRLPYVFLSSRILGPWSSSQSSPGC